jgi:catechol 2,3-dioxygenase-like lactoylglutathione lyase family enzyme
MTAQPSPSGRSTLISAEPQLFVTDMAASLAYYRTKLGFDVSFAYGQPPFYAQLARGGAKLNLRHVDELPADPAFAAKHDLLAATIALDHAKPLFLEYRAAGVDVHQSLRTEPWGARTFIVKDLDGNLIAFAADGN